MTSVVSRRDNMFVRLECLETGSQEMPYAIS
jgi:hypothetical protein